MINFLPTIKSKKKTSSVNLDSYEIRYSEKNINDIKPGFLIISDGDMFLLCNATKIENYSDKYHTSKKIYMADCINTICNDKHVAIHKSIRSDFYYDLPIYDEIGIFEFDDILQDEMKREYEDVIEA